MSTLKEAAIGRTGPHWTGVVGLRPVRTVLPLALAVGIQVLVLSSNDVGTKRILVPVSYLLLVAALSGLPRGLARSLLFVGVLLNLTAIAANGGLMPITPEAVEGSTGMRPAIGSSPVRSKDIVLLPEETRLGILTDRIPIPGTPKVVSGGDLVLALALFVYALSWARPRLTGLAMRSLAARSSYPRGSAPDSRPPG